MAKRQSLSRFIGVRFAPAQQAKLLILAQRAGEPGNMSAALRWLVDKEPAAPAEPPGPGNASAMHALSSQQAGREAGAHG